MNAHSARSFNVLLDRAAARAKFTRVHGFSATRRYNNEMQTVYSDETYAAVCVMSLNRDKRTTEPLYAIWKHALRRAQPFRDHAFPRA